jgi:hypothetical protein
MPATILTRFHLRPEADSHDLGIRANEVCRLQQSLPGRLDCRYYWSGDQTVVVLLEAAHPAHVMGHDSYHAVASQLGSAFSDVAHLTDFEVWQPAFAAVEGAYVPAS